ncbi:hypothetical protein FB45DRAFT_1057141 [Roridomyces roridus]|uniref:Uncharacterized protein n=1 Tax=Roridomyces roridus TaxID=1738132 RepID=A0AAD7FPC3_9AGAR|nr:hypothetical protein FB45DRAFT_1057141 [Roridomyces roridus]
MLRSLFLVSVLSVTAPASPSSLNTLHSRAAADNTVSITSSDDFCMIIPRNPHTNIGDSEHPGGMQTFCSSAGHYSSRQGTLPNNFWSNVAFKKGVGAGGGKFVQLTGCIQPKTCTQLNPTDDGGQYDSSGGEGGRGNPEGSTCIGYNHYVEIVEPGENRACIRCCDDPADCLTSQDTSGCPDVIAGDYFDCN